MNIIHPSARIADGVELGSNNIIGENVVIGGFKGEDYYHIEIGNHNIIHDNVRIMTDVFCLGDGNIFHNHISIMAGSVIIGDNCWVAQYALLDGMGSLHIHDDVAIGYNCYVWSHVNRPGGVPEGCLLIDIMKPTRLMSGVWLMGCNVVVNPGVTMAENSVALPNSVVTKDTKFGKVYGGIPAIELDAEVWE